MKNSCFLFFPFILGISPLPYKNPVQKMGLCNINFGHDAVKCDTVNASICQGEVYHYYGRLLKQSGTFDTSITNVYGQRNFIRLNLMVRPLPIATLADTTTNQLFSQGNEVALVIAEPSPHYHYQWKRNKQKMPDADAPYITTTVSGDYQLVITTDKGCVDSSKVIHLREDTAVIGF